MHLLKVNQKRKINPKVMGTSFHLYNFHTFSNKNHFSNYPLENCVQKTEPEKKNNKNYNERNKNYIHICTCERACGMRTDRNMHLLVKKFPLENAHTFQNSYVPLASLYTVARNNSRSIIQQMFTNFQQTHACN